MSSQREAVKVLPLKGEEQLLLQMTPLNGDTCLRLKPYFDNFVPKSSTPAREACHLQAEILCLQFPSLCLPAAASHDNRKGKVLLNEESRVEST